MSTFDGLVNEFPDIRIDYFRAHARRKPPAACFLTHVHSDHLLGLESLKMPFVYCSGVTRRILLRMEKYPHRINFQKGILEARKQTYKHLKLVLRPLPLDTPVKLELGPKMTIQVTLFDANHCPGAVMFLIEGHGNAILYTGDVRAEPWWVNALVRNPVLLPYTCGLKALGCLYLDTTFASYEDVYRNFPSKAEGLAELLSRVSKCPANSIFYLRAWTLGYEDVWLALANYLNSRVHVDDYQYSLYSAASEESGSETTPLVGFQVGNSIHPGCLTSDGAAAIHSCELGMDCHTNIMRQPSIVRITPIVARLGDGREVAELGAGGGGGDLYQSPELELGDVASIQAFEAFLRSTTKDESRMATIMSKVEASRCGDIIKVPLEGLDLDSSQKVTLTQLVDMLSSRNTANQHSDQHPNKSRQAQPRAIHFPYSRHSSFSELRHLVSKLRPKDICPCTVDPSTWSDQVSMERLFGDLCSDRVFRHDARIRKSIPAREPATTADLSRKRKRGVESEETASEDSQEHDCGPGVNRREGPATPTRPEIIVIEDDEHEHGRGYDPNANTSRDDGDHDAGEMSDVSLPTEYFESQSSPVGTGVIKKGQQVRLATRRRAYRAAKSYIRGGASDELDEFHLRSTGWKGHTEEEVIL